ncbi:SURF1 family cytochrome oxidase biogenesis protein [Salinibacterium soli]|uniref:SURF1 family cytochrome oxidase biogenesis protein n=1 Tax=Antiquaquibacter soli TaxID=3064523 RepID=UPI00272C83D7|nr:SURF1 family protein [Protaetiibacter sp. WY-16]
MTGVGWRFALSRRWLGYLALVVVFAVACSFLAMWQLARREEARQEIERVEQNWDSAPVSLAEALPDRESFDADDKWIPVEVTGTYLTDEQLLVRGRPLGGAAGFEVLVPLLLEDGSVFIVDRGWVPAGNEQDEPDAVPAPPTGEVTVVARLKAGEPVVAGRSAPEGQIATINLPDIQERLGMPVYTGAYGLLASESPAPSTRPTATVRPEPDEGPHLSYAFQWFVFGLLAFVALGWAIRQEYRYRNSDDPAEQERAERRRQKAAARRPSDNEEEDALLDR